MLESVIGMKFSLYRTWNEVVKREIQLRGIQRVILNSEDKVPIINELMVRPHIAIMFIQKETYSEQPTELIGK